MLNYQKTGNFIREERKKLNFSQEQLGNLLYVTRQAVSKWECGKCMPDCNSLLQLSKIFSVSLDEIISGKRKQKKSRFIFFIFLLVLLLFLFILTILIIEC